MITVSAVVLRDRVGRVLLVRKRGTDMWMNPGGKPEPGEAPAECAVREVGEELGLQLVADQLAHLGRYTAPAANEAGHTVVADVFVWPMALDETPSAAAEIAETRWVAVDVLGDDVAPLYTDWIAPALAAS